jgi:hypothetical protein
MLGALLRPSHAIRRTVILAAAVALMMPLPAHCASCSPGATDCLHCQAAQASTTAPVHRDCCERHAIASRQATSIANCSSHVQSKTCGCNLQVPDRTYIAADRQIIVSDLTATLPSVQPLLTIDAGQIIQIAAANENVPPPVPHRILHCSWII